MDNLQGLIFDIDGVLVDSNDAQAEAWRLAMSEYGIAPSLETVARFVGIGSSHLLPTSIGVENYSLLGQALNRRRREIFSSRFLPHIKPMPFAAQLLAAVHDAGLKTVVVSSSECPEARALIDLLDADQDIDEVVTATDARHLNPTFGVVRAALRQAGLAAHAAALVGDTPYDRDAAVRAQVDFIGLRCSGYDDAIFKDAIDMFESPADMLLQFQRRLDGIASQQILCLAA